MTIPRTLPKALAALKAALCPEAILGREATDIDSVYHAWAKLVHEDLVPKAQKPLAHEAFLLLTKWREQAEAKVKRGTYGDEKPTTFATLHTKTAAYELVAQVGQTDIATLYEGTSDKGVSVLVKVARSPVNTDLMKAETQALPADLDPKHAGYFPALIDSFDVQRGKAKVRANVFNLVKDAVSLVDVRKAYPDGLDPKDAAWMWNRLLEALHLLHVKGRVHGNVTPDRFLIVPETHQGILTDFCFARSVGEAAKAISPEWRAFYPPELLAKKPLDFGADLFMAARCMAYLLGSDTQRIPVGTPVAIAGLLRSCWLGAAHRANSAKQLHADFKDVRAGLRWSSAFRPFTLSPSV